MSDKCVYMWTYTEIYIHICICICISIFMCILLFTHTCIYIYICTYVYWSTGIFACTYMYTQICASASTQVVPPASLATYASFTYAETEREREEGRLTERDTHTQTETETETETKRPMHGLAATNNGHARRKSPIYSPGYAYIYLDKQIHLTWNNPKFSYRKQYQAQLLGRGPLARLDIADVVTMWQWERASQLACIYAWMCMHTCCVSAHPQT